MEVCMERKEAAGMCSLSIHYLFKGTPGSPNPTSTGLFSRRNISGPKEDAPAYSTCKLVPRHIDTATACCTLHPDGRIYPHARPNCFVTLANVVGKEIKSQPLTCTKLVSHMHLISSRCLKLCSRTTLVHHSI